MSVDAIQVKKEEKIMATKKMKFLWASICANIKL
jgi:hypothetical protein